MGVHFAFLARLQISIQALTALQALASKPSHLLPQPAPCSAATSDHNALQALAYRTSMSRAASGSSICSVSTGWWPRSAPTVR